MKVANYLYELTQELKSDKYYVKHVKLEAQVKEIQAELLAIENKSVIFPSTDYSKTIDKYKKDLAKAKEKLQSFLDSEVEIKESKSKKSEEETK